MSQHLYHCDSLFLMFRNQLYLSRATNANFIKYVIHHWRGREGRLITLKVNRYMRKYPQNCIEISLPYWPLLFTVRTNCKSPGETASCVAAGSYLFSAGAYNVSRAIHYLSPTLNACCADKWWGRVEMAEPVLGILSGGTFGLQVYLCSISSTLPSLKGFAEVLSTLYFSSHLVMTFFVPPHILVNDSWTDLSCLDRLNRTHLNLNHHSASCPPPPFHFFPCILVCAPPFFGLALLFVDTNIHNSQFLG